MTWMLAIAILWVLLLAPVSLALGRGVRQHDECRTQQAPDVPAFVLRGNGVPTGNARGGTSR